MHASSVEHYEPANHVDAATSFSNFQSRHFSNSTVGAGYHELLPATVNLQVSGIEALGSREVPALGIFFHALQVERYQMVVMVSDAVMKSTSRE